jgi:hypothetical protein
VRAAIKPSGIPRRNPLLAINGGWKEFHLVAEPVEREFTPGMIVWVRVHRAKGD